MSEKHSRRELEDRLKRLAHHNEVLRAARKINQLVIREKKPFRLLEKACRILVETRDYYNAFIVQLNEGGPVAPILHVGLEGVIEPMAAELQAGNLPDCAVQALKQPGLVTVNDPVAQCRNCPLSQKYSGRAGIAMQLAHAGRIFGWMSLSVPTDLIADREEQHLLEEVAADIAFALSTMEVSERFDAMAQRYAAVIATTSDAVVSLDMDGRIRLFNPGAENLLACPETEAYGIPVGRFFPRERRDEPRMLLERLNAEGTVQTHATELLTRQGRRVPVEMTLDLRTDGQGRVFGINAIVRDVTERRMAEMALAASEEKYRALYEKAPLSYQSLDAEGRFLDVNPTWLNTLGYAREDVIGRPYADFLHPDFKRHFARNFPKFKRRGHIHDVQVKLRHKGGHYLDVSSEGSAGYGPDGSFQQAYCVFKDITEQKRAEESLREHQRQLATLMSNLPGMAYRCRNEPHWPMLFVSEGCLALTGYSAHEMTDNDHMAYGRLIHPEDDKSVWEDVQKALSAQRPFVFEYRIRDKAGVERWVWERGRAVDEASDGTAVIEGFISDITDRKQAELNLKMREKFQRAILAASPVALYCVDPEGKVTAWNESAERVFGWRAEEVIGRMLPIIPEEKDEEFRQLWQRGMSGEKLFDLELVRVKKNGELIDCSLSTAPFMNDAGEVVGIVGAMQDITERKKAEKGLRRLMSAIEHTEDNIVITDTEGTIRYVNPAFERITGYTVADAIGENPRILKSGQHDATFYHQLWETISSGVTWEGRITNKKKDGSLYTEEATISPVFDDGGQITNYVAVKRDITEDIRIAEKLNQAQKMEAIGSLAGGIAHDFNNILFPIIGLSEMLMEDLPADSQEYENACEIHSAGQRGGDLVKQIMAFSHKADLQVMPVYLQKILKEVLKLCRATIPSDIELKPRIEQDCGAVLANPTQMHQIAMNLITNALHAIEPDHGEIEIELKQAQLGGNAWPGTPLEAGGYAVLRITDTGCGIAPDILGKVFEPYFTTKEKGKGTGLGLAMVYGIVKEHGGDIRVSSAGGQGATFQVYLPLMEKPPREKTDSPTAVYQTGDERILLVDDEDAVTRLETHMLASLGYRITAHTGSLEALAVFRARPEAFDLVITDMTMPKMTGDQLARELMAIRPDIPIVLCTGFSERINREKAQALGIKGFLMKPVDKSDLAGMVREVLDNH